MLVARVGIKPTATRFKGGAPISVQSAGQWWAREELNPLVQGHLGYGQAQIPL